MPSTRQRPTIGRYLYIARELSSDSQGFKAGKSRQLLRDRERGLRGQSSNDFEMLRTFDTLDEALAEKLAFEEFDANGWRKYPGSKREQFENCTLEEMAAVMRRACRVADADYELSGRAQYDSPVIAAGGTKVAGNNDLTRRLLAVHMTHQRQRVTLGQYLTLAMDDGRLFKRLEKLGIRHLATTLKSMDLRVSWHQPNGLTAWLRTSGVKLPSSTATDICLKMVA